MKRFLIILFVLSSVALQAQIYPVQVNTQLMQPYTPYLSDYTAPGAQKIIVQFRVNDPTITQYRCKLRFTIEGVGITLRTKQSFVPQPIVLEGGGIPQLFYGEDLAEYFDPNNLDFAGFSRNEYSKTGKLPEGVYRFSIEVLDYNRNIVVSNTATTVAWIILNDPPLLNLPRNETKIPFFDPTNIVFTWTPRHRSSPNAALSTEYVFRLVEIWPAGRNPYDAFLTQPPLFETHTDQSHLLYGPAEPALLPGRKYAWQVQAVDANKRDLFKNQGRSEVYVFQYGDALGMPANLHLQSANPSTLNVRWDPAFAGPGEVTYRIRYRLHKDRTSDEWYEAQTTDHWKALAMLQPETEYDVQVRAEQYSQQGEYSKLQTFKTLIQGENQFVCQDNAPPVPLPETTTPLFQLAINDTIHAGGYDVLVKSVSGGSGTYTGTGVAIVPWFNSAKVRVTFESIRVNEHKWLTSGTIKSIWNPESEFLLRTQPEPVPSQAPTAGEIPVTIVETENLLEIEGTAIATISKDEEGNVVVHTTDGQQHMLAPGESYSVIDAAGNAYVIDDQGNIAKTTEQQARAAHERSKRNYNLAIRFEKGKGKFGFDSKEHDGLAQNYQRLESGEYIAWKAISSSEGDIVNAIDENNNEIDPSKLKFEINASPLGATANRTGSVDIIIPPRPRGMVEELLATYDNNEEVVGKLNIVSYDRLNMNLVIVPVNGAKFSRTLKHLSVSEQLSVIYRQAAAQWSVIIAPDLEVELNNNFDDGESGLLTNYTPDMKKVIQAYGQLQDQTLYIFLVDNPKSGTLAEGYMPRSKQAGFVFASNHDTETELIRSIAHELGHGAFNLKHTFSEYPSLTKRSTNNLMDYNNGTELWKYQWDYIHDPVTVLSLFHEDGESEAEEGADMNYTINFLNQLRQIFQDDKKIAVSIDVKNACPDLEANLLSAASVLHQVPATLDTRIYVVDHNRLNLADIQRESALRTHPARYFVVKIADDIVVGGLMGRPADVNLSSIDKYYYIERKVAPETHKCAVAEQLVKDFLKDYSTALNIYYTSLNTRFPNKICGQVDFALPDNRLPNSLFKENGLEDYAGLPDDTRKQITDYLSEFNSAFDHSIKTFFTANINIAETTSEGFTVFENLSKNFDEGDFGEASYGIWMHYDDNSGCLYIRHGLNEEKVFQESRKSQLTKPSDKQQIINEAKKTIDHVIAELHNKGAQGWTVLADEYKSIWKATVAGLSNVYDMGRETYETGQTPIRLWNNTKDDYKVSPFHDPTEGIGTGGADAIINKVAEIPQLVSFGYDIATKEEVRTQIGEAVRGITVDKIKEMALDFVDEKKGKYIEGGNVTRHEASLDIASIGLELLVGDKIFDLLKNFLKKLTKEGREALIAAIKEKLTDPDQVRQFIKDIDGSDGLLEKISKNPNLIDAWRQVLNSRIPNRRTDLALLDDVDKFTKTFKQPGKPNRIPANADPPYRFKTSTGFEVPFDKDGFPDFREYCPGKEYSFKFEKLFGNETTNDFARATKLLRDKYPGKIRNVKGGNFEMEINGEWKKYTWHHHQDGQTLMPVLFEVHSKTLPHTGGNSIITNHLEGMYESPF